MEKLLIIGVLFSVINIWAVKKEQKISDFSTASDNLVMYDGLSAPAPSYQEVSKDSMSIDKLSSDPHLIEGLKKMKESPVFGVFAIYIIKTVAAAIKKQNQYDKDDARFEDEISKLLQFAKDNLLIPQSPTFNAGILSMIGNACDDSENEGGLEVEIPINLLIVSYNPKDIVLWQLIGFGLNVCSGEKTLLEEINSYYCLALGMFLSLINENKEDHSCITLSDNTQMKNLLGEYFSENKENIGSSKDLVRDLLGLDGDKVVENMKIALSKQKIRGLSDLTDEDSERILGVMHSMPETIQSIKKLLSEEKIESIYQKIGYFFENGQLEEQAEAEKLAVLEEEVELQRQYIAVLKAKLLNLLTNQ